MQRWVRGFALVLISVLGAGGAQAQQKINPTDPQPTCPMCPGTYIPVTELDSYLKKALDEKLLDQQVRDIDPSLFFGTLAREFCRCQGPSAALLFCDAAKHR